MSSDLYVFTGYGECRSCHASILWFRTPAGKNMPVDDGHPDMPMVARGDTFSREEGKDLLLPNNHWASCPTAQQHRT